MPYPPIGDVMLIIPSLAPLHVIIDIITFALSIAGSVILRELFSTFIHPVLAASRI